LLLPHQPAIGGLVGALGGGAAAGHLVGKRKEDETQDSKERLVPMLGEAPPTP
jgi:hypothetical protein